MVTSGNTVFLQTGDYYNNPITFKAALERIQTDYNYRNVDKIVIVQNTEHPLTSLIIDDTYTWACRHRLTIMRDRLGKTIIFNKIQNICCDVTFKNLIINLNSSLCKIFGVSCQELRFEDDHITINDADYYLVDNTGQKPSEGFAKYISIYLYRQPSVHNYYRNTWNANNDATRFVVDVHGTYNGGGNV